MINVFLRGIGDISIAAHPGTDPKPTKANHFTLAQAHCEIRICTKIQGKYEKLHPLKREIMVLCVVTVNSDFKVTHCTQVIIFFSL